MFTVVYEKIGVAGSHGTQDHTIDSFPIIVSECKTNLDFFINKCRHDINKHNFNRNTKFSINTMALNLNSIVATLTTVSAPLLLREKAQSIYNYG